MIQIRNAAGTVEITDTYLANLLSHVVSGCFGVVGMAKSGASQGLRSWMLKSEVPDQGVLIRNVAGAMEVDLHIFVTYGLNIQAIVSSIINKTSFTLEQATGQIVRKVNVFVDGLEG